MLTQGTSPAGRLRARARPRRRGARRPAPARDAPLRLRRGAGGVRRRAPRRGARWARRRKGRDRWTRGEGGVSAVPRAWRSEDDCAVGLFNAYAIETYSGRVALRDRARRRRTHGRDRSRCECAVDSSNTMHGLSAAARCMYRTSSARRAPRDRTTALAPSSRAPRICPAIRRERRVQPPLRCATRDWRQHAPPRSADATAVRLPVCGDARPIKNADSTAEYKPACQCPP